MIALFIRIADAWRAWRIRRIEAELAYSAEAYDSYVVAETNRLNALRAQDTRTSEQIVEEINRRGKMLG